MDKSEDIQDFVFRVADVSGMLTFPYQLRLKALPGLLCSLNTALGNICDVVGTLGIQWGARWTASLVTRRGCSRGGGTGSRQT